MLRERGTKPGDEGEEKELPADVIVLATGFKRPDIGFLDEGLFPEGYDVSGTLAIFAHLRAEI